MKEIAAVIVGVVIPYIIMFSGVVIVQRSRNNETTKGVVAGMVLLVVGGLALLGVSILLVHELAKYAPYFN